MLKKKQMNQRLVDSQYFLHHCARDRNFLSKLVKMVETWFIIYLVSSIWKSFSTPPLKKAKIIQSMGKVMLVVFLDTDGVLLKHPVCPDAIMNAQAILTNNNNKNKNIHNFIIMSITINQLNNNYNS